MIHNYLKILIRKKNESFRKYELKHVSNIRVDEFTGMSAACLSPEDGSQVNSQREVEGLLGVGLGKWFKLPLKEESAPLLPFHKINIIEYISIAIGVALFLVVEIIFQDAEGDIVLALTILMFLLPSVIMIITCIILEIHATKSPHELLFYRFFASVLKLDITFSNWPSYVYISDGGHTENFGLLPLIRRKCKLIFICDGSYDPTETCDAFLLALNLSEERLYCSFLADNPSISVSNSFKTEFIGNPNKARYFTCKVRYSDGSEGNIVYLKSKKSVKWNGMFWDCCKSWSCCSLIFGQFPQHSTANQFFSPGLYSLYQEEGFRAFEDYKNRVNNVV